MFFSAKVVWVFFMFWMEKLRLWECLGFNLLDAARLGKLRRCRTSVGGKTLPAGIESLESRCSASRSDKTFLYFVSCNMVSKSLCWRDRTLNTTFSGPGT